MELSSKRQENKVFPHQLSEAECGLKLSWPSSLLMQEVGCPFSSFNKINKKIKRVEKTSPSTSKVSANSIPRDSQDCRISSRNSHPWWQEECVPCKALLHNGHFHPEKLVARLFLVTRTYYRMIAAVTLTPHERREVLETNAPTASLLL